MTDTPLRTVPLISAPSPLWIRTSLVIALLVMFTSTCGIFLPATYAREMPMWAIQAVGQDWANLAVALILIAGTYSAANRSLRGFLVWLGALVYLVYAFAIYAFALHFPFLFLAYVAILGLSGYTLAGGLMAAEQEEIARILGRNPAMNQAAVLLAATGLLFSITWLSAIIPDLLAGTVPSDIAEMHLLVNPVHVLDLAFILPGMIATAFLILRRNATGFLMAVPLLVFSATMGLGIIAMNVLAFSSGLPYSVPAVLLVGLIIVLSTVTAYRCLYG